MRVLHIHSGNLYGGVETALRTIARCRSMAPFLEPAFALSFDGRVAAELRAAGCPVHILGPARARNPHSVMQARARLAALCRASAFDVAIAHSMWSLAVLAPAATGRRVLYLHDLCGGRHWTDLWSRWTPPDLILANSAFTAAFSARHCRGIPLVTVYPPAELSRHALSADARARIRASLKVPQTAIVILQASRFEAWKGQQLLLESVAALPRTLDWRLWIAGEPQRPGEARLRIALENRARDLAIAERVSFLGHLSDMPRLMSAADIYCQPNVQPEAFGLTFVEALHARLPVVSTAMGGAAEILSPHWGLLAAPNARSVSAALEQLILDPDLRRELAQAGPLRAQAICDPRAQLNALAAALSLPRGRKLAA